MEKRTQLAFLLIAVILITNLLVMRKIIPAPEEVPETPLAQTEEGFDPNGSVATGGTLTENTPATMQASPTPNETMRPPLSTQTNTVFPLATDDEPDSSHRSDDDDRFPGIPYSGRISRCIRRRQASSGEHLQFEAPETGSHVDRCCRADQQHHPGFLHHRLAAMVLAALENGGDAGFDLGDSGHPAADRKPDD